MLYAMVGVFFTDHLIKPVNNYALNKRFLSLEMISIVWTDLFTFERNAMTAEEIIIEINKLLHGSITKIDLKTFQRTELHDFKTEITIGLSEQHGHTFKAENLDDLKTVLISLSEFDLHAQVADLSKTYQPGQPIYITVTRNVEE